MMVDILRAVFGGQGPEPPLAWGYPTAQGDRRFLIRPPLDCSLFAGAWRIRPPRGLLSKFLGYVWPRIQRPALTSSCQACDAWPSAAGLGVQP